MGYRMAVDPAKFDEYINEIEGSNNEIGVKGLPAVDYKTTLTSNREGRACYANIRMLIGSAQRQLEEDIHNLQCLKEDIEAFDIAQGT